MTDHKFEPFQQVLVRNAADERWKADFYSHHRNEIWPHECAGDVYEQCIPYTPETAHLLGTTQPYEPPKPLVEYEWGQKVEVFQGGEWRKALYIAPYSLEKFDATGVVIAIQIGEVCASSYPPDQVRPLPDSAAH